MRPLLAVALALVLQAEISSNQTGPIFVGVLRSDGLLLPIAIHDGTEWWNRWPFSHEGDESVQRLPLPASLDRIPEDWLPPGIRLPGQWRVQLTNGGNATVRPWHAARPKTFSLATMIGLLTDYPVASEPPGARDSELRIAVAGDVTLGRFAPVGELEARSLFRAIEPALDRAEAEEIAFRLKEMQPADRDGRPVAVSTLRSRVARVDYDFIRAERLEGGRRWSAFDVVKEYGQKSWPGCDMTVTFSGIVVQGPGDQIRVSHVGAYTLFECTRAAGTHTHPLATLHWGGATLWIMRHNAEDGFSYGLIDPTRSDPAFLNLRGWWQLR